MFRLKRPSPALVISIMALVAAIVVPAYAALTKKDKKTVKNIANTEITKRAPGLAVASANSANTANTANSANTAANANALDGQDASDFTAADEVHNTGRVVMNDPGGTAGVTADLFVAGPITVQAICEQNVGGFPPDRAEVRLVGPAGTSYAGVKTAAGGLVVSHHAPDATFGHIFLDPVPGNEVRAGHLIAVTPDGQVVSVSASLEVNDTASGGDCVFGVTAIGP